MITLQREAGPPELLTLLPPTFERGEEFPVSVQIQSLPRRAPSQPVPAAARLGLDGLHRRGPVRLGPCRSFTALAPVFLGTAE